MTVYVELIRKAEVKRRASISNTLLHELLKAKQFPQPTHLTDTDRLPVWDAAEVDQWIKSRLELRDGVPIEVQA